MAELLTMYEYSIVECIKNYINVVKLVDDILEVMLTELGTQKISP